MKPFGNLIEIDETAKNGSQYIDVVCLIACQEPNEIPLKLKTFVGNNSYIVQVDIMVLSLQWKRLIQS